jgi:hypothetical protein
MKKISMKKMQSLGEYILSSWKPEYDVQINRDTANYKRSIARLGIPLYPETKVKISLALKGRPSVIVVCPHCEKQGGNAAMHRWHFDNCKLKKI